MVRKAANKQTRWGTNVSKQCELCLRAVCPVLPEADFYMGSIDLYDVVDLTLSLLVTFIIILDMHSVSVVHLACF